MPADVNTARVKHVIALPKSLPWGEACACAAGEPHLDWHDRGGDAAAPVWLPGARSRLCRCARACCDTQCWDREPGGAARAEVLRAVALQRRHKAGLVVAQMQRRRQCSLVCLALPEHRCEADLRRAAAAGGGRRGSRQKRYSMRARGASEEDAADDVEEGDGAEDGHAEEEEKEEEEEEEESSDEEGDEEQGGNEGRYRHAETDRHAGERRPAAHAVWVSSVLGSELCFRVGCSVRRMALPLDWILGRSCGTE